MIVGKFIVGPYLYQKIILVQLSLIIIFIDFTPKKIYLAGDSCGGTLVLSSNKYKFNIFSRCLLLSNH